MAGQQYTKLRGKLPGRWDELEAIFEELDITPERIIKGILHLAEHAKKERDQLKAWDMLTKLTGIKPPERVIISGHGGLKIDFDEDSESE